MFRAREFAVPNSGQKKRRDLKDPCAFSLIKRGGLHVVQRTAPPACEPTPIAVDVVSRAVSPASVEEIPAATAGLIRIGVFFRPTATLLLRLFAGCFISHSVFLSFGCCCPACHIIPCGGGPPVMPIVGWLGKAAVTPKYLWS